MSSSHSTAAARCFLPQQTRAACRGRGFAGPRDVTIIAEHPPRHPEHSSETLPCGASACTTPCATILVQAARWGHTERGCGRGVT